MGSTERQYGGYSPLDYYCDYWKTPDEAGGFKSTEKKKPCDIQTCPLIGDYDELVYALNMSFIQVIDWFIYTIATRCQYHKWKSNE